MTDKEIRFYIKHVALSLRCIDAKLDYIAQGVTKGNKNVPEFMDQNNNEIRTAFEKKLADILKEAGEDYTDYIEEPIQEKIRTNNNGEMAEIVKDKKVVKKEIKPFNIHEIRVIKTALKINQAGWFKSLFNTVHQEDWARDVLSEYGIVVICGTILRTIGDDMFHLNPDTLRMSKIEKGIPRPDLELKKLGKEIVLTDTKTGNHWILNSRTGECVNVKVGKSEKC